MSLSRLRTFIEVYRQRSITAAAKSLNLTQPAVSQHIAGLEATVGKPLFERQTHGVEPTSAADELAADIGNKLDAAEAALASARARSLGVAGTLQIIGHADFMAEKLPQACCRCSRPMSGSVCTRAMARWLSRCCWTGIAT